MGNLLSTAKQTLIQVATYIYDDRRSDLDDTVGSYRSHYGNLGGIIYQIDSYRTLGNILNDIEDGNLEQLGYFSGDDFVVEAFLKAVRENQ